MKHPIAKIITEQGTITLELYPEHAPNAVSGFLWAIEKGVFRGRTIKRIVPGFVLQPSYDLTQEPEFDMMIEGEFEANGFHNPIEFKRGIVAMAGDGQKESHGCEFFITLADDVASRLQGRFTAFGKVIDGYDELERLEAVETFDVNIGVEGVVVKEPVTPEIIKDITVDTFGEVYPEPVVLRWGE